MMNGYQEYKKTSLKYVGEIPSEWSLLPLKFICSVSKGKKPIQDYQDFEEGMLPYLSMEFLRNQNANNNTVYVKNDDSSVLFVEDNDLLILWDGSKAGEIVKAKKGALSSTMGLLKISNKSVNIDYLTYYLKSCESYIQDNTIGMGIPHVDGNLLRTLSIAQPSQSEQSKIVHFLDIQTSLIDEIISRKEKQIELLKEKRHALINEAITKGLNPNVNLVDSGIDWLGQIPADWNVIKSKYLSHLITDGAHISPDTSRDDFPFISTVDLKRGEIDWVSCLKTTTENYEYLVRTGCKPILNDILYSKDGTIGKTTVIRENKDFVVASSLIIVRPRTDLINPFYFEYLLRSNVITYQIDRLLSGVALRRISLEKFSNLHLIVPPLDIQDQILESLQNSNDTFLNALDALSVQIEKLKEYRQSIISEAVTGKIDVRDWQPNNSSN